MKWVKRILVVLVIGFVLFYLVKQPEGAADVVRSAAEGVAHVITSIITFFDALSG